MPESNLLSSELLTPSQIDLHQRETKKVNDRNFVRDELRRFTGILLMPGDDGVARFDNGIAFRCVEMDDMSRLLMISYLAVGGIFGQEKVVESTRVVSSSNLLKGYLEMHAKALEFEKKRAKQATV